MERKNIIIGAGISAFAIALVGFYFLTRNEEEKEETDNIETKEEIIKQLEAEMEGITKPSKEVIKSYHFNRTMFTMKSSSSKCIIYSVNTQHD